MRPRSDETARGDLAEMMVPQAASLTVAVREETREEIAGFLGSLDRTELEALAVVLAAMVDPDQPLHEVLSWVDFDECGESTGAVVPRRDRQRTIRAAVRPQPLPSRARGIDMVAVEQALAGHKVTLNERERTAAVNHGIRAGMGYEEVATALGMERDAVQRSWERIKKRARAQGIAVPAEPVGQIGQGAVRGARTAA